MSSDPTNIPAMLRLLADDIASGKLTTQTMLVCWDDPDVMIKGACFGVMPDRAGIAGLFTEAAAKAATGEWE